MTFYTNIEGLSIVKTSFCSIRNIEKLNEKLESK